MEITSELVKSQDKDYYKMNTYKLVLGCAVLLCYMQQYGWAAPSQVKEVRRSINQARLGKLENASLISEHLKATDQEGMLEEVINHSDERENIEHFMNKAGLDVSKIKFHLQKRQSADETATEASIAVAQGVDEVQSQLDAAVDQAVRDTAYAIFFALGRDLDRIKMTLLLE